LRRGISVLIGGVFDWLFCPEGKEFEQANLQKFKCPGDCPEGGVEALIWPVSDRIYTLLLKSLRK